MKRYFQYGILLFLVLCACTSKEVISQPIPAKPLRVLRYLMSDQQWSADMTGVDWSRITDMNLAFVNPDANGIFNQGTQLGPIVQAAHAKKVRIYFSIGGGSPPAHLAPLLAADKRDAFINNIVQLMEKYQFDGVDVDIENDLINENYAPFVAAVSTAVKAKKKLMTCALAGWNGNKISDATLGLYDFINIMSYDKTGPWTPANPGPHSPYSMAQDDFNYYHQTRGIPAAKLLIGLPFYGYGFGGTAPQSIEYKDLLLQFPGAETKDEIGLPDGGKIYYNGIPTIKQKVAFAIANNAAGVMIWELTQDSKDEKSLLRAIDEVRRRK